MLHVLNTDRFRLIVSILSLYFVVNIFILLLQILLRSLVIGTWDLRVFLIKQDHLIVYSFQMHPYSEHLDQ